MGDTANINPLIRQDVKAANTLDAIMHNKYASQPAKLAAWTSANHLEHAAHRNNSKPQPAPQTPPKTS